MEFGALLLYIVIYFGLFTSIFFFLTIYENRHKVQTPRAKRLPTVTVLVPAYNEENTIGKTLDSLLALDYPAQKLQIIVIDDGSKDRTYKLAKTYESKGITVLSKANEGKGKALNFALRDAKGELVCALDADSYVDPKALKRLVGYFSDPEVMAVTPSLKVNSPKTVLQKIQFIEYLLGIYLRKVFALLGAIHVTPGPFSVYRKSFFDKYGAYDHTTITEDIEIALRIQSMQYKIENCVDAFVYTNSPSSFKTLLRQRVRWYRGFVDNVFRYRNLFSPKYGDLGMFILPASFLSVGLVILALAYSIGRLSYETYKWVNNLISIDFDFWNLIDLRFDWFFFDQSTIMLLTILTVTIGITMIYIAKKLAHERISIASMYCFYMLIYMPLFAWWWVCALYYKIANKKIRWAGKMM